MLRISASAVVNRKSSGCSFNGDRQDRGNTWSKPCEVRVQNSGLRNLAEAWLILAVIELFQSCLRTRRELEARTNEVKAKKSSASFGTTFHATFNRQVLETA